MPADFEMPSSRGPRKLEGNFHSARKRFSECRTQKSKCAYPSSPRTYLERVYSRVYHFPLRRMKPHEQDPALSVVPRELSFQRRVCGAYPKRAAGRTKGAHPNRISSASLALAAAPHRATTAGTIACTHQIACIASACLCLSSLARSWAACARL